MSSKCGKAELSPEMQRIDRWRADGVTLADRNGDWEARKLIEAIAHRFEVLTRRFEEATDE